jgi:hypothetical protein
VVGGTSPATGFCVGGNAVCDLACVTWAVPLLFDSVLRTGPTPLNAPRLIHPQHPPSAVGGRITGRARAPKSRVDKLSPCLRSSGSSVGTRGPNQYTAAPRETPPVTARLTKPARETGITVEAVASKRADTAKEGAAAWDAALLFRNLNGAHGNVLGGWCMHGGGVCEQEHAKVVSNCDCPTCTAMDADWWWWANTPTAKHSALGRDVVRISIHQAGSHRS